MFSSLTATLARPHRAFAELSALVGLYGLYEVLRGTGGADFVLARAHTAEIVVARARPGRLPREGNPGLGAGAALDAAAPRDGVHVAAPAGYRRRRALAIPQSPRCVPARSDHSRVRRRRSPSSATSLYPAAPPRLSELGFADTVTVAPHLNLSSDLLGSLYNPFAAVPSMHFGYALIVAASLSSVRTAPLRPHRSARSIPPFMLFDIVATGNHFLFDAAMGGTLVVLGWWIARRLLQTAPDRTALRPVPA